MCCKLNFGKKNRTIATTKNKIKDKCSEQIKPHSQAVFSKYVVN